MTRKKRSLLRRSMALLAGVFAIALVVGLEAGNAAAPQTLTVGVSVPESGALASFGQALAQGASVADDQITSTHFLGSTTLKLDIQDTAGSIATAVSQYQGFVSSSDIGVLCCTLGTEGGALKPIAVSSGVPTVMMTAALAGLPQLPNFVRTSYNAAVPGGLYTQTIYGAAAHWHPKTAVLEVSGDNPVEAGANVIAVWKKALAARKIKLVGTVNSLSTDTDFSGPAATTVADKPDLVILDVQASAAPLLARALQQQGYKGHMVGTYAQDLPALYAAGGSALNGMTMAVQYSPLFSNKLSKRFVSLFQARYHAQPDFFAESGYTALQFLAQAIKNAGGSSNRADVAKAMSKIKTFDTAGGPYTMLGGQAYFTGTAVFVQWGSGGKLSIVWGKKGK